MLDQTFVKLTGTVRGKLNYGGLYFSAALLQVVLGSTGLALIGPRIDCAGVVNADMPGETFLV